MVVLSKNTYPYVGFDTVVNCLAKDCLQVQNTAGFVAIAERSCEGSKLNSNRVITCSSDYVINRARLLEIHLLFAFHYYNCKTPIPIEGSDKVEKVMTSLT